MTASKYEVPECRCTSIPHDPSCPLAPFFKKDEALVLDEEEGGAPFIITCPHCKARFLQTEHALNYDYTPVEGHTDEGDIPLVCPRCGWSDKQTLPAIVGFNPDEEEDDEPFKIMCPSTVCFHEFDRTDGSMDVWMEKLVVEGVKELRHRGIYFKLGQVYEEYTELSIYCPNCGHQSGETED